MSTLTDIVNSDQLWAADRAQYALQVNASVEDGHLSKGEAAELLEDILSSKQLEEQAADTKLKEDLVAGIQVLLKIMM